MSHLWYLHLWMCVLFSQWMPENYCVRKKVHITHPRLMKFCIKSVVKQVGIQTNFVNLPPPSKNKTQKNIHVGRSEMKFPPYSVNFSPSSIPQGHLPLILPAEGGVLTCHVSVNLCCWANKVILKITKISLVSWNCHFWLSLHRIIETATSLEQGKVLWKDGWLILPFLYTLCVMEWITHSEAFYFQRKRGFCISVMSH